MAVDFLLNGGNVDFQRSQGGKFDNASSNHRQCLLIPIHDTGADLVPVPRCENYIRYTRTSREGQSAEVGSELGVPAIASIYTFQY